MNVLFINDSTTNTNWGDRAAASSLIQMVRASGGVITHTVTEAQLWASEFEHRTRSPGGGGEAHATAKRFVPPLALGLRRGLLDRRAGQRDAPLLSSELRQTGVAHLLVPPVAYGPARRLLGRRAVLRASDLIPERWEEFGDSARRVRREQGFGWPKVLRAMDGAGMAVIHGASIDGSGVIPRTDLFLAYLMKKGFGKPVIIVNHTADLTDPGLRRMAEAVYPLFDDVVFRDPISAEEGSSLCSGRFAADSAFQFRPAAREEWAALAGRPTYFDIWPHEAAFDPSRPYLCIGGSSLLWSGWDPPRQALDFAALVQAIRTVYDGQVVLTASDIPDQIVFELVAAELSLPLVGVTTPVQQAVDIIGNSDAYIGGRWHPAIFALRGGAPVIALSSKTFKMQSLMRAAGLPERTFDVLRLGDEHQGLVQQLQQHLEAGSSLRVGLHDWASRQADESWENVAWLRRHATGADTRTPSGV